MYELLVKLQNLIIEFDLEFKKAKKEKNIADFSDIEHLALKILVKENEEPSEIAKKYRDKFEEIAIDEYQDSNLLQENILNSISRGNNIFMVGDVKQSIYKFRQAMPELFLDKYKKYKLSKEESKEEGQKIKLFKNFRSRKQVLDFTNLIFDNIMGERLGEIDYNEGEYLNLGASYKENEQNLLPEIYFLDTEENEEQDEETDTDENNEEIFEDIDLEAKFVAKKIKELLDSKFQVYDTKKEEFRDIQPKDIVVLLRSTKNKANIFEKELLNAEINVYSDSSAEYLESYEIQIIMDLLKIIDNPYQDLPLVNVMRSSIGMFTDDDLLEIRLADKTDDFYTAMLKARLSVDEELKNKIDVFIDKIANWRELNNSIGLDELIWTIYEDTGFLNYVALMPNGELRTANLKLLFEKAKQYEIVSFKGLFNFINFIEKVKTGSGDLGAAKLISENENVVRIMSIHKSKGLEFPIVFVSSTGSQFNMMDLNEDILLHQQMGIGVKFIDYEQQIKYDTISKMALKEKMLEENIAEEMRILYVALTRSKEKLFITGIKKDFEKNKQKMQEIVNIYEKECGKINPILVKKYKKYIDWMLLVYLYNEEYSKEMMSINVVKREDILKDIKEEKEKVFDIFEILEENSKEIPKEEIDKLKQELEFNYKYKELSQIPSKDSVSHIVEGQKKETIKNEMENLTKNYEWPKLEEVKEEITPSKKGTLLHLCMKKLDFSKDYDLEQIKQLIENLRVNNIITDKEAENINPYSILKFTKSNIYNELKQAKEYHQEEPFYINIPASRVMEVSSNENILVQGIIDLYYIDKNDKLKLLDYKTDFAKQGDEEILIKRHKPQLMLYKEALENALSKKVDKIYIFSTSLGKEIEIYN